MKQLNHSPEAAAALLGVSLKVAHERIANVRKSGRHQSRSCGATTTPPRDHVRPANWKPTSAPL